MTDPRRLTSDKPLRLLIASALWSDAVLSKFVYCQRRFHTVPVL